MNDVMLEKYARLIVKTGLNIQRNQTLVVISPVECASFARIVAKTAYQEGARDVVIEWKDELFSKIRFMNAPEEVFEEFPEWQKQFYMSYALKGAAFLNIYANDPELMQDVNPARIMKAQKTKNTAIKEYNDRIMNNRNTWCVVSIPTASWARKVFPGISYDSAVEKLWEAIFKAVRLDNDNPVASWEEHKSNLKRRMEFLNSKKFKFLHYRNSLGTDLKIELPENHVWLGGSEYTPEGIEFIANMPTEEIFTMPLKTGVNGIAVSSKPLNFNGNLIERFSLTFKNGKVIDFSAEKGYENLKQLLETDGGARYLGEVALVSYDSPISNSNILFLNTLFDENASCHLAVGKAYPSCIRGGEKMETNELEKSGANDSLIHEDFMIGTSDLQIVGITSTGEEIPVFKDGNFAF